MSTDGQRTKRYRNIAENFNRLSRGAQTLQTDGRRHIANVLLGRLMNRCHFVHSLLEYICASNSFSVKRFDKVIAKHEMAQFFAPLCRIKSGFQSISFPYMTAVLL